MNELLVEEVEGGIVQLTINRPNKRNAINYDMWVSIAEAFEACEYDKNVRAVILTGAGGCFSAGADISEFSELSANPELRKAYDVAFDRVVKAMDEITKPVIAAIDGYCVGGGLGLAIACDFRFATPGSYFCIPAARLGIVYGVSDTRNLMNLVGLAQAKRILFSAEYLDTKRAEQIGLVDEMVDDNLYKGVCEFTKQLASNAPLSISASKQLLNRIVNRRAEDLADFENALIAEAAESEDYKEGVAAFSEKRSPKFKGQ